MSAKMEGPPVAADLPPNPPAGEATYKAEVHQGTSACGPTSSAARGPKAASRKELRPLKCLQGRGSASVEHHSLDLCIPRCIRRAPYNAAAASSETASSIAVSDGTREHGHFIAFSTNLS